jgi:hypothetical protein
MERMLKGGKQKRERRKMRERERRKEYNWKRGEKRELERGK